jgi:hypothetical protein
MFLRVFFAFFYMGPPFGTPLSNALLVALPGLAFRLLTTPSFPLEDLPDVRSMVVNPEGPGNDLRHPGQGPQIRGVPMRPGPFQEQIQEARSLFAAQPGRPAGSRLGPECLRVAGLDIGLPAAHGGGGTTDLSGDFPHLEALFEQSDGPVSPGLQCCGGSMWSHAG